VASKATQVRGKNLTTDFTDYTDLRISGLFRARQPLNSVARQAAGPTQTANLSQFRICGICEICG
jgi:hypothetical protein